ncbi:TetR family transcriptional regulator [Streptomyces sp. NRRL B-1677]|uniref:TetR/AcrR family transcriptional regulator n=1 Tax=Streptomyces klenkii TaxID=1420899 RepID=A0A3B0BGN3_9ACTN|nr:MULTISPECIES: TetR/AcrR family transcriptional regulator [Streptomyces]MBF6043639.1 TetR family transcriptional regulator [Streptomyces sp. NRRL B-1677]RKN72523.1 TetR/AcrR family transcriptional regulator [Streptomyces klenkii]
MGRPKQFDPDAVVDKAMDVFWRKGYAATTPQDLVDELGIGKGSLYHSFGSKHALFERALERYRDTQAAALVGLLDQPGPVRPLLRSALELLIETDLGESGRRGCLAVNTATELGGRDDASTELVRRMFERTEGAFKAAVERGQRTGEFAPDRDPAAVASLLLAALVGMRVIARAQGGRERLCRVADAALAML